VDKMSLKRDYASEVTWMHVLGKGAGNLRTTVGVIDVSANKRSRFYPIEGTVESQAPDQAALTDAGRTALQKRRAKFILTASAKNNEKTIFGRDFNYGDTVLLTHRGISSTCRVAKYRIKVSKGIETVDIPLSSDEDTPQF
jgi:hypothetical protein